MWDRVSSISIGKPLREDEALLDKFTEVVNSLPLPKTLATQAFQKTAGNLQKAQKP